MPKITAIALFYDSSNKKLLLQNRASIPKKEPLWGFFGGSIKENETKEDALLREIKEELNLKLDIDDVVYLGFSPFLDGGDHIFLVPWSSKYEHFEVLEGDYAEFFTINQMKSLDVHPITQFIESKLDNL